jgi:hypothetical protein
VCSGALRIGWGGVFGVGEKCQDAGSEFVGTLDLRHVTDAGEQTCLCMRNESTGRQLGETIEVVPLV